MGLIAFGDAGLIGRTGNAMFQIAATVGVAAAVGAEPRINGDWSHRPFFSLPEEWYVDPADWERRPDGRRTLEGALLLDEHPALRHIRPEYRVYAQHFNLFRAQMPVLREAFRPSELGQQMVSEARRRLGDIQGPVLSVHIRRGDNVVDPGVPNKGDYFVLPTEAYYRNAIQMQMDRNPEIRSVVAFSDDPDWVENTLHDVVTHVHRGQVRPKEHEPGFRTASIADAVDIALMAEADFHVVSGSTFGLWGAFLAGDLDAVHCWPVYGPKLRAIDAGLLFPSTWTRLELSKCS